MIIKFDGKIIYWRGPAPWYFVTIPEEQSSDVKSISNRVTYGWGVIPVDVWIGKTEWKTSLFPKDGLYLVPIKASVRKAEKLEEGDTVTVQLEINEWKNAKYYYLPQDREWAMPTSLQIALRIFQIRK